MATLPSPDTLVNGTSAPEPVSVPAVGSVNPSRLQLFQRYMREEGSAVAGRRMLRTILGPWYRSACLWFLVRRAEEPMPKVRPLTPCTVRQATVDDLDVLATVGFQTRAQLEALLRSPQDLCFFAHRGGQVLGFQWVALGERDLCIEPLQRAIHLHKDEAYLYNCRAIRVYRAQGIIPAIEHLVWTTLTARGIQVIATDIRSDNRPSLSTMEKVGYSRVERITLRRVLGVSLLRAHRLRLRSRRPVGVLLVQHPVTADSEMIQAMRHMHPESVAIAPSAPGVPRDPRPASRRGRWPLPSLRHTSKLLHAARHAGAEIVHARGLESLGTAWLLGRLGRIRHLTLDVTHDELEQPSRVPALERLRGRLIRWLARHCQTVFVTSEAARDVCVRQGWATASQVQILMKSAMPARFDGDASVASSRLRLGLRPEDPVIGACFGPSDSDLRVLRLIELCRDLDAIAPRAQVLLWGTGPTTRMVKRQIEEAGLAHRITLHRQEDSQSMLEAIDLFLDLSEDPNGSLVALHAIALLRPVVALKASDADGCSLVAAPLTSAEELMRALQAPDHLQTMAQQAFARVAPEFVWRHLAVQISRAWRALLACDVIESSSEHWRAGHGCAAFSRHAG